MNRATSFLIVPIAQAPPAEPVAGAALDNAPVPVVDWVADTATEMRTQDEFAGLTAHVVRGPWRPPASRIGRCRLPLR